MRQPGRSLAIAVCLLACGTGCLQKAATQVATEVKRIVEEREQDRSIQVAVDESGTCRVDEGQPMPLADLPAVMQGRASQIKQLDTEPSQFTIRIRVDDAAPYISLSQVIESCTEASFFKFELVAAGRAFPFDLTPPDPMVARDDLELPPMKAHLRASENGELAALSLNDHELADMSELRHLVMGVIGDDRGPGSIQEVCEVEFDCDSNLKFRHLAAAYQAVSGYEAEDGSRVVLVEKIYPVAALRPGEIEEIEEMLIQEIESLESLEVLSPEPVLSEQSGEATQLDQKP